MEFRTKGIAALVLGAAACTGNQKLYTVPANDPTGFYRRQPMTQDDVLLTYAALRNDPRTQNQLSQYLPADQMAYMDAMTENLRMQTQMMRWQMDDADMRVVGEGFGNELKGLSAPQLSNADTL